MQKGHILDITHLTSCSQKNRLTTFQLKCVLLTLNKA